MRYCGLLMIQNNEQRYLIIYCLTSAHEYFSLCPSTMSSCSDPTVISSCSLQSSMAFLANFLFSPTQKGITCLLQFHGSLEHILFVCLNNTFLPLQFHDFNYLMTLPSLLMTLHASVLLYMNTSSQRLSQSLFFYCIDNDHKCKAYRDYAGQYE